MTSLALFVRVESTRLRYKEVILVRELCRDSRGLPEVWQLTQPPPPSVLTWRIARSSMPPSEDDEPLPSTPSTFATPRAQPPTAVHDKRSLDGEATGLAPPAKRPKLAAQPTDILHRSPPQQQEGDELSTIEEELEEGEIVEEGALSFGF